MISKFLILFFTIFSYIFSVIAITDQNIYQTFDIRDVVYIGHIKIDNLFKNYVSNKKGTLFVVGTELQSQLLYYIRDNFNLELGSERNARYFQYINNMSHCQEVDHSKIMTIGEARFSALFYSKYGYSGSN